MIHQIKKLIPNAWLDIYHKILAKISAFWYGHPSEKLIVIGVTGTNGKTTTAYLIAKALEAEGGKTGCASSALFKVADREWLNETKMTMLGRFGLQKLLKQMVDAGCKYAVIETSSQGIVQHRHEQVAYDIGVFTNLTPEHIEAHGGFENYKQAKIKLFKHIVELPLKVIDWQRVPHAAILNRDDEHAADFAVPGMQEVIWYGLGQGSEVKAEHIQESASGVEFKVDGIDVKLHLMGRVNIYNALPALAVAKILRVDLRQAIAKLGEIKNMPGRFERIEEGQPWQVIVDYAPEPASLSKLYETVKVLQPKRIIHVLGSCGGGRDVARRPILGSMAAQNAQIVIVTNEDPYDDDPMQIIEQVAEGARHPVRISNLESRISGTGHEKKDNQDLFLILDRRQAIQKAMDLAQAGDLVILTGKGSEQRICVANGKKLPWDEREAARQAIRQTIAERTQRA